MVNLFKSKKDKNVIAEVNPKDLFKMQNEGFLAKKNKLKVLDISEKEEGGGFDVAESSEFELGERKEKPEVKEKIKEKRVNIEQYKDLEGITIQKLTIGLWLVEHRIFIRNLFYGFMAIIGIITWSYFIFSFGAYLIFGMRGDDKFINQIVSGATVNRAVILQQSPKTLQFGNVVMLKSEDGKYDFMIDITNVNEQHAGYFDYYFRAGGQNIGRAKGFILPKETKYVYLLGQSLDQAPFGVEFRAENIFWKRISRTDYPDWKKFYDDHMRIEITDKIFVPETQSELTEKVNLNTLKFKVNNNTAYSYWSVNMGIRLMNRNTIIGVQNVIVNNLMTGETREIVITWPGKLSKVSDIVIVPEVNIIDDNVYIKPGQGDLK